jgi:hypothetical protein
MSAAEPGADERLALLGRGQSLPNVVRAPTSFDPLPRNPPRSEYLLIVLVGLLSALYLLDMVYTVPQMIPLTDTGFIVHVIVTIVLSLAFWFCYILASITDPGPVPPDWRDYVDVDESGLSYCGICSAWKPPRTHHCSRCGRCSLKFDHHCFYIANCVGYRNQKYFYLLLFYASVSLLYMSAWSIACWVFFIEGQLAAQSLQIPALVILCLASAGLGMQTPSLGYMFALHTFLIARNTTNLEWVCCKGTRPSCHFTHFSCFRNFQEVLGRNVLLWPLPIRTDTGIHHHGLNFQSTAPLPDLEHEPAGSNYPNNPLPIAPIISTGS